jgi:hypothetical protein
MFMASPERLEINSSVAQSTEIPMRQRLDIVRDCSDLRGTFPQNVELKFIYWTHGAPPKDKEAALADSQRLVPHLMDADRVGFEIAATAHKSKKDVAKEFNIINDIVSGRSPQKRTYDEFYKGFLMTTAIDSAEAVTQLLKEGGRTKPPVFFPFDVCEPWDTERVSTATSTLGEIGEAAKSLAAECRWREGTTLRQLHQLAKKLGHDGKQHQIAVLYGSAHSLTSVAARELGAKTSRVFVDKYADTPTSTLAKYMRFHEGEDFSVQTAEADQAKQLGNLLGPLAELLEIEDPTQKPGRSPGLTMTGKLGSLILLASRNLLLGEDATTFIESIKTLTPFIAYGTEVPLPKRQEVRAAMQPIVDLADRLY